MSDLATTISEAELTRLLPTCQRCRRLRRKCDTQLPACRLCQKGKAECTFFDHALQQTLPRSYVHSLLSRLARLRSVQATINGVSDPGNSFPITQHVRQISTNSLDPRPTEWGTYTSDLSFDKHFLIADANPTCWQFFGSSSAYALAVEVLVHGQAKFGQLTFPENYTGPEFKLNVCVQESLERPLYRPTPSREEVEMLVNLYSSSTNVLNGYSDDAKTTTEIDTYLRHQGSNVKYLTGIEAHQFFRIAMICAIASANKSRHHPQYDTEAFAYYVEAVQCVEEVTSDISVDSLQALLLLVLFVFFYPRRGDVWKLLDCACRLSVELNFHSETNDEFEDEKSCQRRRSIFWGLYCLERTFGQHMGRPSDLPESIITAEYPATLSTDPTMLGSDPAQVSANIQYMLVSHYYRLIYLRSEIFRELYMPAKAPDLPRSWYEQRLEDILSWQREFDHIDQNPQGMGTMTLEMGFHTSITFLFQPLLLRALAATKEQSLSPTSTEVIPKECFESAAHLIEFYDRVMNAPEGTPYGDYPVTIVSAHYIHQATLTIMAHCLLAIDGRLPLVSFSHNFGNGADLNLNMTGNGNSIGIETQPIDFSNIFQISTTCIGLLGNLAARWPGMVGILDIYRNLHDKVMPLMLSMRDGMA